MKAPQISFYNVTLKVKKQNTAQKYWAIWSISSYWSVFIYLYLVYLLSTFLYIVAILDERLTMHSGTVYIKAMSISALEFGQN